jgi:SAM-dependent methyltransferase
VSFPLLREPSPCPVCHGTHCFKALTVYDNDRRSITNWDQLALLGCNRCGLVFSHPLPTEAELDAYYSQPDGWESRTEGDPDTEQLADLDRKLESKHARYARVRDLLAEHLPPGDGPLRALDFGCGLGSWLDVLQDDGWRTAGIEPGPLQHEFAGRRHLMLDAPPTEPTFDLVIVNHVLEHLRDPLSAVRSLAACTLEGGHIFVSVPDLGRLPTHNRWKYVKSEHHICSYTVEALRSLLGLAGFRVIAHFDTPEWDALGAAEPLRLRVLGERTGQVVEPTGEPLGLAIEALRGYEAEAARLRAEARRANAMKKAARLARKDALQEKADNRAREAQAVASLRPVSAITGRIGRALRSRVSR